MKITIFCKEKAVLSEFYNQCLLERNENTGEVFRFKHGESVSLDIRRHVLFNELIYTEKLEAEIREKISASEAKGFYVTSERSGLNEAKEGIEKSKKHLREGRFIEAYIELSNAFLKITDLTSDLDYMNMEAALTVNLIIVMISIASWIIAILLTESFARRLLLTEVFFALMLGYVYLVFPGCSIVSIDQIMMVAFTSLLTMLLVVNTIPSLLPQNRSKGINRFSALLMSFQLGKKNLRLRKLRTALTFTTLTMITMSFIVLTSYSSSFGLVYGVSGTTNCKEEGILMRMPEYEYALNLSDSRDAGYFNPVRESALEWIQGYEELEYYALKAEKLPSTLNWTIMGFELEKDPIVGELNNMIVTGEPLIEDDTCLVHESLLWRNKVEIGGKYMGLTVVGAFGDLILDLKDLDGQSIIPNKQSVLLNDENRIIYYLTRVPLNEVIITSYKTAMKFSNVFTSRATLIFRGGENLETLCKSMKLSSEYRFWLNMDEKVYTASLGALNEVKGMQLAAPWSIMVLIIASTMLGSMQDRKREINVLSSVGINPSHITGIFLSEALILGIVAGCLGYLTGLGVYPLMAEIGLAPAMKMKVSFVWCFASIGISVAAVIVGTGYAFKHSTLLTPSHKRKWNSTFLKQREVDEEYVIELPIHLEGHNYEKFIEFLEKELNDRIFPDNQRISTDRYFLNYVNKKKGKEKCTFSYVFYSISALDNTRNKIVIDRDQENFVVRLTMTGSLIGAQESGVFIRKLILKWAVINDNT